MEPFCSDTFDRGCVVSVPAGPPDDVREFRGASSSRGFFDRPNESRLPGFNFCAQFTDASTSSVSLRSNPVETSSITTHLGHRCSPIVVFSFVAGCGAASLISPRRQLMIPVALAAITAILAWKGRWIPAIVAVAFQALAVLPASARLIILASFRLGLADLAVFCFRCNHHDERRLPLSFSRTRSSSR